MNNIEKFKELFGYGSFRSCKGKTEVRVKHLDTGLETARKIIKENGLSLEISSVDPQLRSFEISPL